MEMRSRVLKTGKQQSIRQKDSTADKYKAFDSSRTAVIIRIIMFIVLSVIKTHHDSPYESLPGSSDPQKLLASTPTIDIYYYSERMPTRTFFYHPTDG